MGLMRARVLIASMLIATTVASAHPIHTTYATLSRGHAADTLWLRAFADDFSAAVARFSGRPTPSDSSAALPDVARYLAARVEIMTATGVRVTAVPCGTRRAAHLTWTCLSWPRTTGLRLVNRMLADLHSDQVNVVQVTGGGTLLFTGASAKAERLD